jgi:hypothetical protein
MLTIRVAGVTTAVVLGASILHGCGSEESPTPAGSSPTDAAQATSIPADFPLDAGWPSSGDRSKTSPPVTLDLCGVEPWSLPEPESHQGAEIAVGERIRSRDVLVYSTPDAAEGVLVEAIKRVKDCEKEMTELGGWLYGAATRTGDDVQVVRWYDPKTDTGAFTTQLFRRGHAVLISESGSDGKGREAGEKAASEDRAALDPALEALADLGR